MAFNDQNYHQRMMKGGDPAENQFRVFAKKHKISAEHYGFDRSKLKSFSKLPQFIRSTPDFACVGKIGFLVECKGVGRDGIIKIKANDLDSMYDWSLVCPLYVFVNDSYKRKVALVTFHTMYNYITEQGFKEETFDSDGKTYYAVPIHVFDNWEKAATKEEVEEVTKNGEV